MQIIIRNKKFGDHTRPRAEVRLRLCGNVGTVVAAVWTVAARNLEIHGSESDVRKSSSKIFFSYSFQI